MFTLSSCLSSLFLVALGRSKLCTAAAGTPSQVNATAAAAAKTTERTCTSRHLALSYVYKTTFSDFEETFDKKNR